MNSPGMLKQKESKGILQDTDVINVLAEVDITVDNNKLPVPESLPVPKVSSQYTLNRKFGHNGLCHRRM